MHPVCPCDLQVLRERLVRLLHRADVRPPAAAPRRRHPPSSQCNLPLLPCCSENAFRAAFVGGRQGLTHSAACSTNSAPTSTFGCAASLTASPPPCLPLPLSSPQLPAQEQLAWRARLPRQPALRPTGARRGALPVAAGAALHPAPRRLAGARGHRLVRPVAARRGQGALRMLGTLGTLRGCGRGVAIESASVQGRQ